MAAKRVRWECPNGLHPGVLGSTRPPKDAVVRFCWPCSQESGRLVARSVPALERQRAAATAAATAKKRRRVERDRERAAAALIVPVIDAGGATFELNAGELLAAAWKTDELQAALGETWKYPGRQPMPELVIRRGRADAGRPALRAERGLHPDSLPIRERDAMSGRAWPNRIVLTVRPGLGHEWLRAIVVHEAAHSACVSDEGHGRRWRSAYLRAVRELYGVGVANVGANWQLDEHVAQAIFDSMR